MKLVVAEEGSDLAAEFWATPRTTVYSSILSIPESQSAVAKAERTGRLTEDAMDRSLTKLDDLLQQIEFVEIDLRLAEVAGAIAVEYGLRGYDATHLAAALSLRTADPLFVAWDANLNEAASRTGLNTALE